MSEQTNSSGDSRVFSRSDTDEASEAERTQGLIDPIALGAWMDSQGLPGQGEPVTSRFVSGGASNEIFEICRGEHRWALRRPPRNVPEGRNETMMREFRILSALADTDVPHARAAGGCDDTSVMGAAFYLMDFVDGWSPISEPGWPEPFASDMDARPGLAYELVDAIARLSKVDWQANGLEGLGRPDGFHERQVDRWYAHPQPVQVPRHPRARRSRRLAPGPHPPQLPARHHARRLPVRQCHVPPRRPRPDGRRRRLGDGYRRRPAARPRLGGHELARRRGRPAPQWATSTTRAFPSATTCWSATPPCRAATSTRSTTT